MTTTPELLALATAVAVARLGRMELADARKGSSHAAMRIPGEQTPAEIEWFAMCAAVTEQRRAEVAAKFAA